MKWLWSWVYAVERAVVNLHNLREAYLQGLRRCQQWHISTRVAGRTSRSIYLSRKTTEPKEKTTKNANHTIPRRSPSVYAERKPQAWEPHQNHRRQAQNIAAFRWPSRITTKIKSEKSIIVSSVQTTAPTFTRKLPKPCRYQQSSASISNVTPTAS